jgi:hypothetical protein
LAGGASVTVVRVRSQAGELRGVRVVDINDAEDLA